MTRRKSALERPETTGDTLAAAGSQSPGDRATAAPSSPTPNGCMRPPRPRQDGATPPTEAEIRSRFAGAVELSRAIDIGTWVYDLTAPLRVWERDDAPPAEVRSLGLWDDLRPSEAKLLEELVERIYQRADALEKSVVAEIGEYVVEAAMLFAGAYPTAPRAR